jgi:hypothetical protein
VFDDVPGVLQTEPAALASRLGRDERLEHRFWISAGMPWCDAFRAWFPLRSMLLP